MFFKASVREAVRAASRTVQTKMEKGKEEDPLPLPMKEKRNSEGDTKGNTKGKGPKVPARQDNLADLVNALCMFHAAIRDSSSQCRFHC